MQLVAAIDRCRWWTSVFLRWRVRSRVWQRVLLVATATCAMGLLAKIRLPLPFTPVPVTGQVFGVLLSGVLLGTGLAPLAQGWYVALGAVGVPWFATGTGLLGPTSGYLVGFVPAAAVVGRLTQRLPRGHSFSAQLAIMALGVGIIYLFGGLGFWAFMRTGFTRTLQMAVVPFIAVDLAKALLAAGLSTVILPRKPYR